MGPGGRKPMVIAQMTRSSRCGIKTTQIQITRLSRQLFGQLSAFAGKGDEDEDLLKDGFVLGEEEIKGARDEELPILLQGTQRTRRLSQRAGWLSQAK